MKYDKNYFAINRKLFNNELWQFKPFSKGQAWIDLIGLANHEDGDFYPTNSTKVVHGKRGNVYRSISWLAERWGWSYKTTYNFLLWLNSRQMVEIHTDKKGKTKGKTCGTFLTLVNYDDYQLQGSQKGKQKGKEKENERENSGKTKGNIQEIDKSPKEIEKNILEPSAEVPFQPEPEDEDDEGWMKPEDLAKYHPTKFKRIGEK